MFHRFPEEKEVACRTTPGAGVTGKAPVPYTGRAGIVSQRRPLSWYSWLGAGAPDANGTAEPSPSTHPQRNSGTVLFSVGGTSPAGGYSCCNLHIGITIY